MAKSKATTIQDARLLDLTTRLYQAREAEAKAKAQREALEFEFTKLAGVPADFSGSRTFVAGDFKVTYKRELRASVDSDKLVEIVNAHQFGDEVKAAFRWKAEMVKVNYTGLSDTVKTILAPAITTKMGKESVKVEIPDKTKEEGDVA